MYNQNMEILKKQNWTMIVSLLLWITITLIRVLHHSPWYDEAHAWLIAQELNLIEIFKLMKIEGHTFLWYLCLMPFAKSNFMYPYSMLLLNWLFCFIAVLIIWLKSPFSNWVKILITFSFPFFALYPVVARCYSIGIMFLFLLASMEKSKLKHPNWYALLLVLCANTSVMASVGATVFGGLFLYELVKNKKNLLIPTVIMLLGAILFLVQLFGSTDDIVWEHSPMGMWFFNNIFFHSRIVNVVLLAIFSVLYTIFYIKNKAFPIFLTCSYFILFIIICVYSGHLWHWFFFYIYFLISIWLSFDRSEIKWGKIYISIFLCVISFIYVVYKPFTGLYNYVWHDKSKYLANSIIKNENHDNLNVIIQSFNYYPLIPFLNKTKIKLSNYCSGEVCGYDTTMFTRSKYCYVSPTGANTDLVYEQIDKVYDANRKNIILCDKNDGVFRIIGKDKAFLFTPAKVNKNDSASIYFVEKINYKP